VVIFSLPQTVPVTCDSHMLSGVLLGYCFLVQNGLDCEWMDTREVLIVNPSGSNQVDPDFVESEKRLEEWFSRHPSKTIVATGFIASTPQNIPTTLKRDGSDFSAAIMGAMVRARQVTIWTDVDGVYSADPRKGLCLAYTFVFLTSTRFYLFCCTTYWETIHILESGLLQLSRGHK